jgi:hypothetical protein
MVACRGKRLKYEGVALLIDPYVSRVPVRNLVCGIPVLPDTTMIERILPTDDLLGSTPERLKRAVRFGWRWLVQSVTGDPRSNVSAELSQIIGDCARSNSSLPLLP